jgi:hypothetical protein
MYWSITLFHLPCAFRMYSTASRKAPSPPSWGRDVVGFPLHFSSRVFHRNGQAAGAHGGQIDYIVADERGFFRFETFPAQNFLQTGAFVLNALMNVFQLQVAGTPGPVSLIW